MNQALTPVSRLCQKRVARLYRGRPVSAVPLPPAALLLGAAFAGLGVLRRRAA